MTEQNNRMGIWMMVLVTFIFSVQDAASRHLGELYDIRFIVMVRFWFFALFAVALSYRATGSAFGALKTKQPIAQFFRALIMVLEIGIMVVAFTKLGLVETHAIFACYPLIIAALSGPILGESVGWRRWVAIGIGFIGVLIILQPSDGVFSLVSLWAVVPTVMFATYGIMNRYVARKDSAATSFFWMGVFGMIMSTAVGVFYWENMAPVDWIWMLFLCIISLAGHYLLIRAYEVAQASAIQPFAYLQLPFASFIGVTMFGDNLRTNVVIGAVIVVTAGVFTLIREQLAARKQTKAARAVAGR
ncbi:EamA family transporter [Marivivens niveibacter]|uniref:EamA family transporter n=1 Tax=Marivivens niveibacter TaxID=1930667 RepID=A0A251WYW2_9RHOB|nr:DMT family transporter [Marivivens niveibacter]OUD09491.1 EamA family transporter [Marivivens niveibacter]